MAKHKLAVVGYGDMGSFHCELLNRIERLDLAGIWDIKEERRTVAREAGIHVYSSFHDLLSDPQVDIVLIATPNDVHKELAVEALHAGKNVVSEKPVAMSSQELQEMIDAAHESGKMFTVHQNRRWDEDYLTIRRICESGVLGPIFNVESRVHGSRGIPGDWRQEKAHGGGMMLDWGVHIIDQMLLMIPEKITSVYCTVTHVTNEEVDDGFTLILTFESGIRALLEVGTSNFVELPRWYLQGRDGTAVINDWDLHGKIVRVTNWDKNDAVPIRTAAGLTKTMAPRTDDTIAEEPLPVVRSDLRDFYENVMDTIEGKAEQIVRHDQVMRVMRLMETALRSAEEGRILSFE